MLGSNPCARTRSPCFAFLEPLASAARLGRSARERTDVNCNRPNEQKRESMCGSIRPGSKVRPSRSTMRVPVRAAPPRPACGPLPGCARHEWRAASARGIASLMVRIGPARNITSAGPSSGQARTGFGSTLDAIDAEAAPAYWRKSRRDADPLRNAALLELHTMHILLLLCIMARCASDAAMRAGQPCRTSQHWNSRCIRRSG